MIHSSKLLLKDSVKGGTVVKTFLFSRSCDNIGQQQKAQAPAVVVASRGPSL